MSDLHHLIARRLDTAVDRALGDASTDLTGVPTELRRSIARAWIEHAASERAEALSLAHVATVVLARSGPGDLHWLATRATSDELRHAAICHRVAQAYDPDVGPLPAARRFPPFVTELDGDRSGALFVLAQCCIQETLAAAYLSRAYDAATAPLARAALHALLGDEIDHGRIGYAFAALLDREERRSLRGPLAACIERCRAMWRARADALPAEADPEHGVLPRAEIHAAIDEAMQTLVTPGLLRLGLC